MSKRRKDARPRRERPQRPRDIFVSRPFDGLVDEPEWIALRELVPAATAPLQLQPALRETYGDRPVTLATLLPMASAAMSHADGQVLVGLQRGVDSGDANRDVAASILAALATDPGDPVSVPNQPGEGPRLADILADHELDITVHEGFDFWLAGDADRDDPAVAASLERANGSIYPTVKLAAARGAYWCQVPERSHLRWVLPDSEERALTALARLSASDGLKLRDDTKFAGMFRAQGLLVPVWDLPRETPAAEWEEPLAALSKRYAEALAVPGDLTPEIRRARHGLIGRQLTLR
ncbi:DUF5926 family protein [Natronosporangium hydrolyticum]|uniref:DUF5926 family protein n=1 Tax=Natronosporangium hydrolyticum TaxID=2811111 RepID=UPI001EFA115D|nr:DUF5926 family protein [Natronosporangium hydrolyticum]